MLLTTPFWANLLYTVNIVAATVASLCGAVVGLIGVWRIVRPEAEPAVIAAVAMVADLAVDTLARTLWGEARGGGEAGMIAVAAVIRNRVDLSARLGGRHWWGADWIGVCRARGQFASWSPGNPNRVKLLTVRDCDPDFRLAKRIAADAIAGRIDDPTYGATAYRVADRPWPYSWGHFRLPLAEIGRHAFYNFAKEP